MPPYGALEFDSASRREEGKIVDMGDKPESGSRSEFGKRLGISILCLPITIPLSVIGQGVLQRTHWLDSSAQWISDRVLTVEPDLLAWVVALTATLVLYGLLLAIIHFANTA